MKIDVQIIDTHGFIHFERGKSKELIKRWLAQLKEGTEIHWTGNNSVFVSQQYIKQWVSR